MNDRIALLALKASDPKTGWLDRQKFAELIVRECAKVAVEHEDYCEMKMIPTYAIDMHILEHFGVEE
jgi:hypothetical protein